MEAEYPSNMLLRRYQTTRYHNPQAHNVIIYIREVWTVRDQLSCPYVHLYTFVGLTQIFFPTTFPNQIWFFFV